MRFLQVTLWAFALGMNGIIYVQMQAGVPDSGLLLAIFGPLLGLMALGFEYYLRCYVAQLAETPNGLKLDTLTTFARRSRTVAWEDVKLGRDMRDVFISGAAPSVDNSYTFLHLTARRLPLIVDTTRDALDMRTLQRRIRAPRRRNKT